MVTGKVLHHDIDHVMSLCRRVNAGFGGNIEQWPVKWSLTDKGLRDTELENMRSEVGLKPLI